MAGMQLAGLASGMDWKSTVQQLMQLERVPQDRLKAQQAQTTTKQEALDKVKAAVSTLKTAAGALDLGTITSGPRTAKLTSSLAIVGTSQPVTIKGNLTGATTFETTDGRVLGITGAQGTLVYKVSGPGVAAGNFVSSVNTSSSPYQVTLDQTVTGTPASNVNLTFIYSGTSYSTTEVAVSDPGTVTSEDGAATGNYEVRVLEPATETLLYGGNNGLVPTVGPTAYDSLTLSDYGILENDTLTVNGSQYTITAADLALSARAFLTARSGADQTSATAKDGKLVMKFTDTPETPFLGSPADSGDILEKLGLVFNKIDSNDIYFEQKISADALARLKVSAFGGGAGSITINGEAISYAATDTIGSLISQINSSDAGVVAELDANRRRLILRSTTLSGGPISLSESGTLLSNLKVQTTFSNQKDLTKQNWNPYDGDSPYDETDNSTYYKLGSGMRYTLFRNGVPVGSSSDSSVTVDGTSAATFTTSGNSVDLSVHGFGKTKLSVSQAGTYKFSVSGSENLGRDKFDGLVKAYNDLRTQIQDVTKVTVGTDGKVTAAVLSGNRDLTTLLSTIRSRLFSAVEDPGVPYTGFSSSYDRLERLGITFDRNGVLSISSASKLTEALRDYPSRVNALFNSGDSYVTGTGSAGNSSFIASSVDNLVVGQALTGTGIPSGALVKAINTSTRQVDLKDSSGNDVYLTSNISASAVYLPVVNQGISVRLSGLLERALDTSSSTQGLFKTASTAITNQRNTLQRQIELMERQLTARQAALEKSFIDMEKAQSRSQSMLSQLTKAFQSSSSS